MWIIFSITFKIIYKKKNRISRHLGNFHKILSTRRNYPLFFSKYFTNKDEQYFFPFIMPTFLYIILFPLILIFSATYYTNNSRKNIVLKIFLKFLRRKPILYFWNILRKKTSIIFTIQFRQWSTIVHSPVRCEATAYRIRGSWRRKCDSLHLPPVLLLHPLLVLPAPTNRMTWPQKLPSVYLN